MCCLVHSNYTTISRVYAIIVHKVYGVALMSSIPAIYIFWDLYMYIPFSMFLPSVIYMYPPTTCACQVLAYSLGLGTLVQNDTRLRLHMKAELAHNDTPYGMLVLTGIYKRCIICTHSIQGWPECRRTSNLHIHEHCTHLLKKPYASKLLPAVGT